MTQIPGISTKEASEKYDIKHSTLRAAINRGEFPTRLIDGKVHLFDDTAPEFQDWLIRYQRRVAARQSPKEATTKKQQYSRWYYKEHVKPRRQSHREAIQTAR